ncbi:MAG TPA: sugar ABC transporter permease [Bacillales bacterium]|nr:sugar ABC transporter permease [Bacillales bacterium]
MKEKKQRRKRSDWKSAYLLIAPSLILILIIAIYPVFQSFYYSLFDLRLNEPTKSSAHLDYSLNLDEYLQYYPFLVGDLSNEIPKADQPLKRKLQKVKKELTSLDQNIRDDAGNAYKKVNNLLNQYKTPSEKLSLVQIDGSTAAQFQKTISDVNQKLSHIQKQQKMGNVKQLADLASGLKGAIIQPNFVGLKHYVHTLMDGRTLHALWHTFLFTVISVAAEFVFGFCIALLINKAFVGRGLLRAAVLIPWAVPTAVSAMMWSYLYDGQNGIVAKFFADIGIIPDMATLLTSGTGALFAVILVDVWKTTPFMALLLLAGLQVIPKNLYEASAIDGAGKVKQFFKVTLPLMKSSILVALLFRTLEAFRVFDLVYVLTGGGPGNSTEMISGYAYRVMFSQTNFGKGSALAIIVFLCVAIISMIYIKFLGSDLLSDGSKR